MVDTITRPELDAKLEAMEAKADARMSRFEERIDQAIGEMRRDRADMKEEMRETRKSISNLKIVVITTAIASTIGLYAANISMVQTMIASFESGKGTATAITQATEELRRTQEQLTAIKERLDTQAPRETKKTTPK